MIRQAATHQDCLRASLGCSRPRPLALSGELARMAALIRAVAKLDLLTVPGSVCSVGTDPIEELQCGYGSRIAPSFWEHFGLPAA
jgi:hypothetical protein